MHHPLPLICIFLVHARPHLTRFKVSLAQMSQLCIFYNRPDRIFQILISKTAGSLGAVLAILFELLKLGHHYERETTIKRFVQQNPALYFLAMLHAKFLEIRGLLCHLWCSLHFIFPASNVQKKEDGFSKCESEKFLKGEKIYQL